MYLRAALTLVTNRRSRDTLPDRVVERRGLTVDRSHLAAYDRVCGFRLSDTLPATYPHILAFPLSMDLMTAPDFPFPVVGLVHVANRITVARPLSAGSSFDLFVSAVNLRPHDRGQQLDIVAVATVDDVEVWRGVSTYLRRSGSGSSSGSSSGSASSGAGSSGSSRSSGSSAPAPSAIWRVPADIGRQYAAVSGDRNPIHTSRIGARLFGFPRPIAHGMWSMARCLASLDGRLPDEYTVDVAFKRPILLPARVGFHAAPAWEFSVHDAKSGRPHVMGTVT